MGTTAMVANSTIRLSPGWNAVYYWGVWAICIICIGIILWAALKSPKWARWTTQDILIVAALGVLLEVYDNIIGDQVIGPLLNPIPGADFTQIQDLPYMFLLMVGVALGTQTRLRDGHDLRQLLAVAAAVRQRARGA
jgi:hypothetical protein